MEYTESFKSEFSSSIMLTPSEGAITVEAICSAEHFLEPKSTHHNIHVTCKFLKLRYQI